MGRLKLDSKRPLELLIKCELIKKQISNQEKLTKILLPITVGSALFGLGAMGVMVVKYLQTYSPKCIEATKEFIKYIFH